MNVAQGYHNLVEQHPTSWLKREQVNVRNLQRPSLCTVLQIMLTIRCCSIVAMVRNDRTHAFTLRMLSSSAVTPESQIPASETSFQCKNVEISTVQLQHGACRAA